MMTVLLVGSGPDSEKSLRPAKSSLSKEMMGARAPVGTVKTVLEEAGDSPRTVPVSVKEAAGGVKIETKGIDESGGTSSTPQEARTETGSQFGVITPDEWQIIRSALERVHSYPRLAREHGIEGIVQIRFKILPSGGVERVELVKSSGYEILDSDAIRTVYKAGRLPYVKKWIEVPISYYIVK